MGEVSYADPTNTPTPNADKETVIEIAAGERIKEVSAMINRWEFEIQKGLCKKENN